MPKGSPRIFQIEGDGMESGSSFTSQAELAWIDGEGMSHPVMVLPGKFRGFVDMAMERQKRLILADEGRDGATSCVPSSLD